uniref:Uncharacterized protein n=1 Tax=Anguilla anguilla TaxID=7936 RepID=A0A0E9U598_ANGAN
MQPGMFKAIFTSSPLHGYTHYMYTQLAAESHPGEVIYAPTNYGGKSVLLHVDSAVA